MNFLHYEFDLSAGDVVEVTLDKQANVRLLDGVNFSAGCHWWLAHQCEW